MYKTTTYPPPAWKNTDRPPSCGAQAPGRADIPLECTAAQGHEDDGPHVAHLPDGRIMAHWTDPKAVTWH